MRQPHAPLRVADLDGVRALGREIGEAPIGRCSQSVAFSADNKTILGANMVENELQVLRLDGDRLTDSGQRIKVKGGPVAVRVADK